MWIVYGFLYVSTEIIWTGTEFRYSFAQPSHYSCSRNRVLYKNNHETAGIPVILFSANPEIERIAELVKANGFLKKPFDISDLLFMVQKYFKVEI
jgi:hypothetical protein